MFLVSARRGDRDRGHPGPCQTGAAARAAELKGPVAGLDLKDGDSIVFFGDSITHQRLYTQYVEDYFYTRFPNKHLKIHNAGVSGSVAWEALTRFEGDVAAYKPKYVTVLLGMNDGNHEPFNQTIFETYRRNMTTIFHEIQRIGATPIILSPDDVRRPGPPRTAARADADSTALYNAVLPTMALAGRSSHRAGLRLCRSLGADE